MAGQVIMYTNAGLSLIGPLQTNFSEISTIFKQVTAFENVVCEMVVILSWDQCVKTTK